MTADVSRSRNTSAIEMIRDRRSHGQRWQNRWYWAGFSGPRSAGIPAWWRLLAAEQEQSGRAPKIYPYLLGGIAIEVVHALVLAALTAAIAIFKFF